MISGWHEPSREPDSYARRARWQPYKLHEARARPSRAGPGTELRARLVWYRLRGRLEPDRLGQRRQPRSSSAEAPSSSWASLRERGRGQTTIFRVSHRELQGRASGGGEVRRVRTARPRICRTAPTRASVVRRAFRGFKLRGASRSRTKTEMGRRPDQAVAETTRW